VGLHCTATDRGLIVLQISARGLVPAGVRLQTLVMQVRIHMHSCSQLQLCRSSVYGACRKEAPGSTRVTDQGNPFACSVHAQAISSLIGDNTGLHIMRVTRVRI